MLNIYLFTGKFQNCKLIPERTKNCFPGEIFMGGACALQRNTDLDTFFSLEMQIFCYLGALTLDLISVVQIFSVSAALAL